MQLLLYATETTSIAVKAQSGRAGKLHQALYVSIAAERGRITAGRRAGARKDARSRLLREPSAALHLLFTAPSQPSSP